MIGRWVSSLVLFCALGLVAVFPFNIPAPFASVDLPILRDHLSRYPGMRAEDLYKLIYQSAAGPGHLGAGVDHLLYWLEREQKEMNSGNRSDTLLVEPIGSGYVRIHLNPWLKQGGSLRELAELVNASSLPNDTLAVKRAWYGLLDTFAKGRLSGVSSRELMAVTREAESRGWPPIHHSSFFMQTWHPHYRVLARSDFMRFCQNRGIPSSL